MSSAAFLNSRQVKLAMEARKKMEQEKQLMEIEIENSKKIAQRTNFEITTTAKIESRMRQESLASKKTRLEHERFLRRQQLADLYNMEMEQWRSQILSKTETIEERKSSLLERAHALRDAREAARRKLVQDKLDAQWRDGCDDARALDSKELTKYMGTERVRQIAEKENRRQNANMNESVFLAEWTKQLSTLEERDKAKEAARAKATRDNVAGIAEQIKRNEDMKNQHALRQQEEDEKELTEIQKSLADEAELRLTLQKQAIQRGKEVLAFNALYQDIRAQEEALEAERDATLLQHALKCEREKIAEENAKAEAGYEAARQYRRYLEELMVKEKENTGAVDEINKREAEKVWKARDDALKARQDARDYLMKLVNEGRQQQIAFKAASALEAKEFDRQYALKFIDDIKEGIELDKQAADLRRKVAEDNNTILMKQIEERRRQEELAQQEVYLADKQMRHIEKQHQERLARQGGNLRLQFPLKKAQY